jgi:phosphatidylserine/phosphatidylglycerophosphate/cardiolipin synthase-like enzyme
VLNKAKVVVITRPAEDFPERDQKTVCENTQRLKDYGIEVRHKSGFHQKFTVIDGQTVWYGSVNFLSFGTAEESIMRFTSNDIAGQLMDTVL